jgi:hypothetical protein
MPAAVCPPQLPVRIQEIIDRFAREAVDFGDMSRAEYAAFDRGEIGKWAKTIRDRGIKAE